MAVFSPAEAAHVGLRGRHIINLVGLRGLVTIEPEVIASDVPLVSYELTCEWVDFERWCTLTLDQPYQYRFSAIAPDGLNVSMHSKSQELSAAVPCLSLTTR